MKIVKDRNIIQKLFSSGKSFKSGNILSLYFDSGSSVDEILFTAPIKKFKRAVDRNKIKRLMREAWRKNEKLLNKNVALVYINNNISSYNDIEKDIINIIKYLE